MNHPGSDKPRNLRSVTHSSKLFHIRRHFAFLLFRPAIALLAVLLSTAMLSAQTGGIAGSINGVVTDASGGNLKDVNVTVTGVTTGFVRSSVSDAEGIFTIPFLPAGTYNLTATASGYETYVQKGIEVHLDSASTTDILLKTGSVSQMVSVEADATILNTDKFEVSGQLSEQSMVNMPITSRNTFNLALLTPGLNGTRDNEFGNPTFAFGGMQRKDYMIDGIDNSQRGGPGRLGIFSPEDVKEIKVVSAGMDAEFGRTVGGKINMITKGGDNQFRGEGLLLERRPGLIAKPPLTPPTQGKPFQQWEVYSVNVSGPIVKDKLFHFLSGEYEPEDGSYPVTITAANAAALNLPASELVNAPFKQRFQSYLARLDYQLNPNNNFYLRGSLYKTPSQYNTSGGLIEDTAGNDFNDHDSTAAAQWTHIFSPRMLNDVRYGFLRRIFDRPPVSGVVGPVISISGVAQLGSNSSANQHYEEDQFNFIENFSYTMGKHQLKFGADVDTIHVQSIDRLTEQFSFANLPLYLNTIKGVPGANYTTLTEQFGDNTATHRTTPLNLYAEDRFQVSQKLALSYGLRWEYRWWPTLNQNAPLAISRTLPADASNFAPRIGFDYRLGSKTVLRAGYGINYDTLNLRLISLVDRSNGQQVQTYTISGSTAGAPQYPNAFTGPASSFAAKLTVYGFAPNIKTQYAHQMDVQVERALSTNTSITLGLQGYVGGRAPVLIDTNLGPAVGTLADGRPSYAGSVRPNPSYNQIFALTSIGTANYYGSYIQFAKRLTHGLEFTTSYTLGWAHNNNDAVGDSGSNVTDSNDINRDYAYSSSDQRNRWVLQGVWQPAVKTDYSVANTILNHWTFAPDVTITSGFPYSALAGSDLNGDGVNNDYPLYGSRNNFRGPGFQETNLRISRKFPIRGELLSLEVIGEAENLTNSVNVACSAAGCGGIVNQTWGSSMHNPLPTNSTFGTSTSDFNSRQIQLGGRLWF